MGREEGEDRSGAVRGAAARGGCQTSHRPRWLAPLEHVSNSWLPPALQLFCVHLLAHAACTCPAGSSPGDSPLVTRQPHIHPPDAAEGCRQLGGCDHAAALASQVCRRRRECRLRSGMRVGVREGHGMWGSERAQCPCANAADQFAVTTQACKTCHPCRPPSAGHSSCCCGQRGMRAWQRRQAAAHVCIVGGKGVQREVEVFAGPAEAGAAAPGGVPLRPRLAVPIRPCTGGGHRRPPHARCIQQPGGLLRWPSRRDGTPGCSAQEATGAPQTDTPTHPHTHTHTHTHTPGAAPLKEGATHSSSTTLPPKLLRSGAAAGCSHFPSEVARPRAVKAALHWVQGSLSLHSGHSGQLAGRGKLMCSCGHANKGLPHQGCSRHGLPSAPDFWQAVGAQTLHREGRMVRRTVLAAKLAAVAAPSPPVGKLPGRPVRNQLSII